MNGNIHKVWGERRRILLTDITEIDLLYLKPHTFCSTHTHKHKINKFVVVSGEVHVETEYGDKCLKPTQSFEVYPGIRHRFVTHIDSVMVELAYVKEGKIDPDDIDRISQGGRFVKGKEMTHNEMRDKGLLNL